LLLDDLDDLFGDAFEARGFLGRAVDFGMVKLIGI
jgi:hypothetical protein